MTSCLYCDRTLKEGQENFLGGTEYALCDECKKLIE